MTRFPSGLPRITPQLFPPSQPAFNFRYPSSAGSGATWGGSVYDIPVTANGEPIHGGYGDALKWTGKAVLKYPWVHQRLDVLKDGVIDFAWRSAPWWQRGLEIGLGVGAGTAFLWFKPSREFIRDKLHGTDIPLSPLGLDWLSVQPRLGIGGYELGLRTSDSVGGRTFSSIRTPIAPFGPCAGRHVFPV